MAERKEFSQVKEFESEDNENVGTLLEICWASFLQCIPLQIVLTTTGGGGRWGRGWGKGGGGQDTETDKIVDGFVLPYTNKANNKRETEKYKKDGKVITKVRRRKDIERKNMFVQCRHLFCFAPIGC